jgi:hypothetical protein
LCFQQICIHFLFLRFFIALQGTFARPNTDYAPGIGKFLQRAGFAGCVRFVGQAQNAAQRRHFENLLDGAG